MENDTVKLLRECDAGIKMGVGTIDQILEYVKDKKLHQILSDGKKDHEKLKEELQKMLVEAHDEGKDPKVMAKGMSWMKTNMKLVMHESDATIADLVTEGCDMGVKSLARYLNEYKAADPKAQNIAQELIIIEEGLAKSMREYL